MYLQQNSIAQVELGAHRGLSPSIDAGWTASLKAAKDAGRLAIRVEGAPPTKTPSASLIAVSQPGASAALRCVSGGHVRHQNRITAFRGYHRASRRPGYRGGQESARRRGGTRRETGSTRARPLRQRRVQSPPSCGRSQRPRHGRGRCHGGKPASAGHLYSFGSTDEKCRVKILGCRRRGRPRDGAFNHSTGRLRGRAAGRLLRRPRCQNTRLHMSGTSRLAGPTSQGQEIARHSTKYGRSRTSTKSFFLVSSCTTHNEWRSRRS